MKVGERDSLLKQRYICQHEVVGTGSMSVCQHSLSSLDCEHLKKLRLTTDCGSLLPFRPIIIMMIILLHSAGEADVYL